MTAALLGVLLGAVVWSLVLAEAIDERNRRERSVRRHPWLVVIDSDGVAHVIARTATAILAGYAHRTLEHAESLAAKWNVDATATNVRTTRAVAEVEA